MDEIVGAQVLTTLLTADSFTLVLILLIITAVIVYFISKSFGKIMIDMINQISKIVDAISMLSAKIERMNSQSFDLITVVKEQTLELREMRKDNDERYAQNEDIVKEVKEMRADVHGFLARIESYILGANSNNK